MAHLAALGHLDAAALLLQEKRIRRIALGHLGIGRGARRARAHVVLLELRHEPLHRGIGGLGRQTLVHERVGHRAQALVGRVRVDVVVGGVGRHGLPTPDERHVAGALEVGILLQMALLLLILVVLGEHREEVLGEDGVDLGGAVAVLGERRETRRHDLAGAVRAVGHAGPHMRRTRLAMRQKRRVDADEGGDGIDLRQHLVELLDGDALIFRTRVTNDLSLIHLLIRI